MAAYTTNYRLHQWEAEDHFLRTDFNQDFAKIDAAIQSVSTAAAAQASAADAKAQRALDGLEPLGYNLCQLMLQNYYDGKHTGSKRALLFDGFVNASAVASKSSAIDLTGGRAVLWGTAVGPLGAAPAGSSHVGVYYAGQSAQYPAPRTMDLTAVTFWMSNHSAAQPSVTVYVNGTQARTLTVSPGVNSSMRAVRGTFSALRVQAGDKISVRVARGSGEDFSVSVSGSGSALVCQIEGTAPYAAGGTITGISRSLSPAPASARAWVRHSGGTVSLTLGGKAMTRVGTRSTTNLQGEGCTESSFRLEGLSTNVTPVLTVNGGGAPATYVYDYGVMFF